MRLDALRCPKLTHPAHVVGRLPDEVEAAYSPRHLQHRQAATPEWLRKDRLLLHLSLNPSRSLTFDVGWTLASCSAGRVMLMLSCTRQSDGVTPVASRQAAAPALWAQGRGMPAWCGLPCQQQGAAPLIACWHPHAAHQGQTGAATRTCVCACVCRGACVSKRRPGCRSETVGGWRRAL